MRVMQIIGSRNPGGAETFFLRLVQALRESCDVLPVARRNSWLAAQLSQGGLHHETVPFGGWLDLRTRPILRAVAESFRPDVIQCWMSRAARFAPRKCDAVIVGRLGGYYDLKYYRAMDYLVANTPDIARYIRERGWPEDRFCHLPNFADPPSATDPAQRALIRARYDIPDGAFVLLAAGRLHRNKGFDLLLTALKTLPETVYLFLAGDGPLEATLREAAERDQVSHRVRFVGWMPQLAPLIAASDLWVVPSRHEPLGNVILDAWVHRLPVVATATKGPETLIQDGATGLLVKIDDPKHLAAAIAGLIADPPRRQRLARAGEERAKSDYSAKAAIARYLDFYRRAIEGGRRPGAG